MQGDAELTNNMIDLMQAGKCPHRLLAASPPPHAGMNMRQVEMAAFFMSARPGTSAPHVGFVSRLRQQILDECSRLERG